MVGTGWVASIAALILTSRCRARPLLPAEHPLPAAPTAGGSGGSASDIEIEAREILKMRDRLNRAFAQQTGQTARADRGNTRRNFWLTAERPALRTGRRVIEHQAELGAAGEPPA